jgi:hypothetical protein
MEYGASSVGNGCGICRCRCLINASRTRFVGGGGFVYGDIHGGGMTSEDLPSAFESDEEEDEE